MASHLPKNHHLRSFYHGLAFVAGLYCLAFGIIGVVRTAGHGVFATSSANALGLRTNTAFAVLSIVIGAAVVIATLIGRNVDRRMYLVAGPGFLVMGLVMLVLLDTSINFLNFQMATCIVSFIIGLVLMAAGLYVQVGHPEEARQEEGFRHSEHGDPHAHNTWGGDPTRSYEQEPAVPRD